MTIEHTGTWTKTIPRSTFSEDIEDIVAEGDGEYFISVVLTISGMSTEDYIRIIPRVRGREYPDQPEFHLVPIRDGDYSSETTVDLAEGEELYLNLNGYIYQEVSFTVNWTILAPSFGIPVTPQAPTFLDEEPWVVLPVQDHITYSVSGTPGWNSSVTVTATADEGYSVSGQSEWTKAWGARPLPSNALIQDDIDMVYFGTNEAESLYRGSTLVWTNDPIPGMGPEVYLTFDSSISENLGTQSLTGPTRTGGGGVIVEGTAEYRGNAADRFSNYQSSWSQGATLMAWVRTVTARGSGTLDIIQRNAPSGVMNELYIIEHATSNIYGAGVTTGGNWFAVDTPNLGGEKDRQWHHLAVTVTRVNATTINLRIYIDGTLRQTSGNRSVPEINFTRATELYLAQSRLHNTWAGNLDRVATFDRPLSDSEIETVYDSQIGSMPFIPTIETLTISRLKVGEYYFYTLMANFNATSWSATGLPAGVTISDQGAISGTPTTASNGTMTVTASGANGQVAYMDYDWIVDPAIPALTNRSITASGANKVSHSGWSKPALTWSLTAGSGGTFNSDGTLVMLYGEGRVRFTSTLNASRQARIVSNIKGVLVTSASTSSHNISSSRLVFEAGERIHIELNGYTSNTSDRFTLAAEP